MDKFKQDSTLEQEDINQSVKNIKDQFDQQQSSISLLRNQLKKKEDKQHEKGMEDYATRLAKMKPRLMSGRGRGKVKTDEKPQKRKAQSVDSAVKQMEVADVPVIPSGVEPTAPVVASVIEVPVPPAVVDQNPLEASFTRSRAGSSSSDIPTYEQLPSGKVVFESDNRAKVLQLRKQIEENRVKFLRQQREKADNRAMMEDMKDKLEKYREEVQHRDSIIESLQNVESFPEKEMDVHQLYQQILQKDNHLLDLSDRVQQLENLLKDQKEKLDEKDQIITARTEAVSLVAKDRDEKIINIVESFEESKNEIRNIQSKFIDKEEIWLQKEQSLNEKIEEKNKKINLMKENYKRIENVRFELSARNAELQEKIVAKQSELEKLKDETSLLKINNDNKISEIQGLQTKLNRAEAFGQKKLKNLEKQVKNMAKDSGTGEKLLELNNTIAELEEEKGNLQLKLVDFDELKSSSEQISNRVKEMETKLAQANQEILSQMNCISGLEKEKSVLVDELNSQLLSHNSLEDQVNLIKKEEEELNQTKVTLELRICALEEERDIAIQTQKDRENEEGSSSQESIEEINAKNLELETINSDLQNKLTEIEKRLCAYENVFKEKENIAQLAIEEKDKKLSENECLISLLAEKESEISAQSIDMEKHSEEIANYEETISIKNKEITSRVTLCAELDQIIRALKLDRDNDREEIEKLHVEIDDLQSNLKFSEEKIASMKEAEKSLNAVLMENQKNILILEGEICSVTDEVDRKAKVIEDQLKKLEYLSQLVDEKESTLHHLEAVYSDQNKEKMEQDACYKKLEHDLENIKSSCKQTESKLTAECEAISCMLADRDNQVLALEQELEIKWNEIQNNQTVISKFENELCEKNRLYDNIVLDNESLVAKVSSLQLSLQSLKESKQESDIREKELEEYSSSYEERLHSMQLHLSMSEGKITNLEKEISDVKSSLEIRESDYKQLKVEYDSLLCNKNNEIAQMNLLVAEKDTRIEELNTNLEMTDELQQEYIFKSEQWEQLLSAKENDIQEACNSLELKNQEVLYLNEQLSSQTQQSENNEQCAAHLAEINSLEENYKDLLASKTELEEYINALQEDIENKNRCIITLQRDFEKSNSNTGTDQEYLQQQIELKEQEIAKYYDEKLIEQTNLTVAANKDLNKFREFYETATAESQNYCLQLQQSLEIQQIQLHEAQSKISELQVAVELQGESDRQSQTTTSPSDFFDQIQTSSDPNFVAENESLKKELYEARLAAKEIESKITETDDHSEIVARFENQLEEAYRQMNELQSNLAMESEKKQELEDSLSALQQVRVSSPTSFFDNLQEPSSTTNDDTINLKMENEALANQLRDARENIEKLEINLNTGRNNSQLIAEQRTQLEMANKQIEDLEAKLKETPKPDQAIMNVPEEHYQSISPVDFFDQFQATPVRQEEAKDIFGQESSGKSSSQSNDSDKNLKSENESLKNQLNEAQQAIVRLETSLATQAAEHQSTSSQDTIESWGVVDLGEPTVPGTDAMTTSLIEKDKTLVVIQEQLKEALEQVYTASDEKKLIQHQMHTLEAALDHKKNKIEALDADVLRLNQELEALQVEVASYREKFPQGSTTEQPQNSNVLNTFGEVKETDVEGEQSKDYKIQELQYNLSWYEENCASWSEHCNQLQTNLQIAEQEIQTLKIQIEENSKATSLEASNDLKDKYSELQIQHVELETQYSELQGQCSELQAKYSAMQSSNEAQSTENAPLVQATTDSSNLQLLQEANLEILRLRDFETQVYELQNQLQTLHHQSITLQEKMVNYEKDCQKLHEYEVLYGELQTSMLESETKREGSKSRIQELELMVESAESEISRLRTEIISLTSANKEYESDVANKNEEMRKITTDKLTFESEVDRLQKEAASLHSQLVESQTVVQSSRGEIEQLKSEVEVFEGEIERQRTNYEITESEMNRLRSENEYYSQNYQMVSAQNESFETEMQRINQFNQSLSTDAETLRTEIVRLQTLNQSLSSDVEHNREEMQRLTELSTSAESEISRLQSEVNELRNMKSAEKISLPDSPSKEIHIDEEMDWGAEGMIEDEHLQRSSSVERNLMAEIENMKQKLIELEREKNAASDELQTTKTKNGKFIQKLKAANNKNEHLTKQLEKMKKQGGFSDLDQALEDEMKAQVKKAEQERDELKLKIDEMEKEKTQVFNKMDVLENAQEKYIEMKEMQDSSLHQMSILNRNLESQVSNLEWRIAEMEETYSDQTSSNQFQISSSAPAVETHVAVSNENSVQIKKLEQEVKNLEQQISEVTNEKAELESNFNNLEARIEDLSMDNENLQSLLNSLKEAKKKSDDEVTTYKTNFIDQHKEFELLKEEHQKKVQEIEDFENELARLKYEYSMMHSHYTEIQGRNKTLVYTQAMTVGERDKLQEESDSLSNHLMALRELETNDIVTELEDECSRLRAHSSAITDEVIKLTVDLKASEANEEQMKEYFDQHCDEMDVINRDLMDSEIMKSEFETRAEKQSKEMKFLQAEAASLRSKSAQQQHALEEIEPELHKLRNQLEIVNNQNQELKAQLDVTDGSLLKLSTKTSTEGNANLSQEEFDAALMSLHLRELRCQQLSLEINKLLEERDSLQLKLSASLRQTQELSRELNQSQQLPSPTTPPPSLSNKLAELRQLNSSLEKKALNSFRASHMSGGGGLPPTFPPTFVSHTAPATPTATRHSSDLSITRESHGSSSTIMGWIMGKSPPKEILHV